MSWYPHAIRDPGEDGGAMVAGYAPKGVLHTTEGTTYAGARVAYAVNGSWPHFTVSFERGRVEVYQHLPVHVAARALRNPAGGVQTNRGGAVQVELVGTCDPARRGQAGWLHVLDFPDGYLAGIAAVMRWVEHACGVRPLAVSRWLPYPASYGLDNGLRLNAADWRAFAGWLGHQHVPENTHGDPGALPVARLLKEDGMSTEQLERLTQVVLDQTGAIYNQANAHHGALIAKLDALPEAIASKLGGRTEAPPADQPPAEGGA